MRWLFAMACVMNSLALSTASVNRSPRARQAAMAAE
jgi:hypothetical protein